MKIVKPTITGTVVEALPNTEFKVKLEDDRVIHTYLGGKMRKNHIRVLLGDRVQVETHEHTFEEKNKSRIVKRM